MSITPDERAQRRRAFRDGARDFLPAAPAVAAWGLVTGVAMVQSGLPLGPALALSLLAFAGSAQLAALPLLATGAPFGVIVLTALMMNLRFVIYSAALRGSLEHLPAGRRLLLGYLNGDVGYAMYAQRTHRDPHWPLRDSWLLGLSLLNFAIWHVTSLIGIFAAAWIPRDWGLELAGIFALLALLVPLCRQVPGAVGAAVAAAVALLTMRWPAHTGLVAAIVSGIAAALAAETLVARRAPEAAP